MQTVTFLVSLVILIISTILYIIGMVQLARKNPRGRGLMTIGFGFWLLAIIVASILFGVFSV